MTFYKKWKIVSHAVATLSLLNVGFFSGFTNNHSDPPPYLLLQTGQSAVWTKAPAISLSPKKNNMAVLKYSWSWEWEQKDVTQN